MSRKSTVGAKRLVANQLMCGAQWSNLKRPRYQMDIAGVFGMSSDRCRSRLKRCSCRTYIATCSHPPLRRATSSAIAPTIAAAQAKCRMRVSCRSS
jgi:hypothetical protein